MPRFRALSALALILALAPPAWAAGGRVAGEVYDPQGEPLAGVRITIRGQEVEYEKVTETNKKGKFTVTLLDATRGYLIRLEKPGYRTIEEPLDPDLGSTTRKEWTLTPGEAGGAARSEAARQAAEDLAATGKGRAVKLYHQGAELYAAGDLPQAEAIFEQTLAEDPDLAAAHGALANIYLDRNEFERALGHATRVTELAPEEVVGYRMLFDAHWGRGARDEALAVLDRLIEMDPGSSTAVRIFNIGVAAVKDENLAEAQARFEQALAVYPELTAAHLPLGQIRYAFGDFEGAREQAELEIAANPESLNGQLLSYRANHELGRAEEADRAFAAAVAIDAERVSEALVDEGSRRFNANQTVPAIVAFRRAIEARPDHPRANYMLGLCLASTGDLAGAKRQLARFLELAPDDPEAPAARQMLSELK